LLVTSGEIQPNSEGKITNICTCEKKNVVFFLNKIFLFVEVFEVACKIQQDIVMHPFAFRTHAHKLGKIFF
jgi:hypothetical protein